MLSFDQTTVIWKMAVTNGGNPFPDIPEAVKEYEEYRKQISEIPAGTRVMAETVSDWADDRYDGFERNSGEKDA